ncbi:pVIII [Snake adenovirus 1]|uniref:Pre-hexon-linking protein VIII n=1 Tax=Snake adenovirus serotype 1 TaxID=189830 RepID=CAP8_ADES1|nr:pVIII [Snake adenovirus 1]A9CB94.1 RecName: Full=Pre-hexon-linking protein VIII; AltName: Full=Pre-protein VIII; Short=pVIII; Contains: RecName: Full=Hexon-linking protein-N; AltName: Full=12.1 kDa protein VIII; AltName: Full=Protein VIII-N; Contains: RecName: Full=Hexon-linking protein-C; AltName: Full=7.6 kDa protein VIII; AltName: Full=Protein VIII-C [Snake adenovirus 1]ABA47244.1 pVIII [Snake adenovirus 1]
MEAPVTPYIWQYQPETGTAAGARQNYGAVINWLSSDNNMYHRVQEVNRQRNKIDDFREQTVRADMAHSFNDWKPQQLSQPASTAYLPAPNPIAGPRTIPDVIFTAEGEQLAGASPSLLSGGASLPPSSYRLGDGREYRKFTRDAMPFPHNWLVKENGVWVPVEERDPLLSEEGRNALSSYPTLTYAQPPILRYRRLGQQLQGGGVVAPSSRVVSLLTEQPRMPRTEGMTPYQFSAEFPPVVYDHPFSRNLTLFPKEFSPLFDPKDQVLATSLATLQYR